MAVCQPAVACLAAASLMADDDDPARPSSLILLAGPVDTRVNPSRVSRFAQRQSIPMLERTMLAPGAGRIRRSRSPGLPGIRPDQRLPGNGPASPREGLPGPLPATCAAATRSRPHKTRTFYREYFAVLDIAGEFYLETAQRVFKDNDLPQGRLTWRGRTVDPSRIESALFTIEGALDEMCTPGQTEAAHALCTGIPEERHRHLLQEGVGHYGVFAGSTFESEIYPQIRDFVELAALPTEAPVR